MKRLDKIMFALEKGDRIFPGDYVKISENLLMRSSDIGEIYNGKRPMFRFADKIKTDSAVI